MRKISGVKLCQAHFDVGGISGIPYKVFSRGRNSKDDSHSEHKIVQWKYSQETPDIELSQHTFFVFVGKQDLCDEKAAEHEKEIYTRHCQELIKRAKPFVFGHIHPVAECDR